MAQNNFVDFNQAKALANKVAQRLNEQSAGLIFKGSKTFATLPSTLTQAMAGYVYNMSESFTTDSRFVEGSGKTYPAGTNVAVADCSTYEAVVDPSGDPSSQDWYELVNNKYVLSTDTEVDPSKTYYVGTISMKFDVASGFIDVESINDRIDDVRDDVAEQFSTSGTYKAGDIVMHNDLLYKFKTDHSAGAWNSAEVDATNIASELSENHSVLTAGANINMAGNVVKAGVVEVVEPDMTVYGNSTESGSKTYTIETTGVYEIFYCLSLQSTVSVTLPNDANVLFENDLTVSSHPVKHIVAELHEGDTVTIAQTPSQWNAVVSGVLKLDAISVVNVAHTGSIADNTITYTLPNDNKYYLVVGACVGKPTGNNAVDSTSGGTPEITRTLTGSGVRFRSVVVKGSDSPSFSFYGYDGGVASIIAYEIEFEEGNWDYNIATKNYVDTALSGKQDTLTFDDTPTDNSNNPVKSNGVYDALALKQDKTDNTLQTTDKTVAGAVNELKSGLTSLGLSVVNGKLCQTYSV